ncbi:unnamed protein product [Vitrella brassicaformis CCMP3155]|uniref:RING-type domain-containing protein n=2 Tax=Vitrella brassicaformis TaxID=1169539 RepID=A0A0G4FIT8_VITBC|nr:unnamed protein product [Vitrella brassicaformis CCMP3155]|eukprot:CEM13566.1 unnamed protein product [Vitrella brassicaformis CCMP3155]
MRGSITDRRDDRDRQPDRDRDRRSRSRSRSRDRDYDPRPRPARYRNPAEDMQTGPRTHRHSRRRRDNLPAHGQWYSEGAAAAAAAASESASAGGASVSVLQCTVCREDYQSDGDKAPQVLACGHSFCAECVRGLIRHHPHGRRVARCPECRAVTAEANIQPNYALRDQTEILRVGGQ